MNKTAQVITNRWLDSTGSVGETVFHGNVPPGRKRETSMGHKTNKKQCGVYLSVVAQNLVRTIAESSGLTMSMVMEMALREYAFNHREELKFNQIMTEQNGHSFR